MQNIGRGQFTYDVFKAAYDADPKLQKLVTNFDQVKIELKQKSSDGLPQSSNSRDSVGDMAQAATDLGDDL